MIRIALASACALLLALAGAGSASAASLQRVGGFNQPIFVTSDPGNPERLFVVEQSGTIEQTGPEGVTQFADLRSVVSCCEERGLLSIALAPDFDTSGRLFVDYTGDEAPGEIHIAELRAAGSTAPISSLRNLLTIPHPVDKNHNGGQLQFGPEGLLFASTGDGGGADDSNHNAQDLSSLLGKILRIDPNPSASLPYTVPAGNPFASPVWSYGLRNPFRFSFDRLSGALLIGDVGQGLREEVDFAAAPGLGGGADYGWNCREGSIAGPATDTQCATPPAAGFVEPIFDYPHADPGGGGAFGHAIIGGYVARDASLGSLSGRYVYGDLDGGIRSFDLADPRATDRSEGLDVENLNSFGEDSCGRLYAVSGNGGVFRLTGALPATCAPVKTPARTFVGIRAQAGKVRRHGRALISVGVSPCNGRRGEPVRLLRGGRTIATRHLDRACTARFRPRISHRSGFRATVLEDATYAAATSRRLLIRINHRKRAKQRR